MARPAPKIIHQQEVGDGTTWDILKAQAFYVITYKGEPVSIRITKNTMTGELHLYKKMTYTNIGSANVQVRRLNHRFKCSDFEVMSVTNN